MTKKLNNEARDISPEVRKQKPWLGNTRDALKVIHSKPRNTMSTKEKALQKKTHDKKLTDDEYYHPVPTSTRRRKGKIVNKKEFRATNEEIDMPKQTTQETEITQDDLLREGPAALLNAIVNEDEDTDELFNAVMGAKIDVMFDLMKNELAAGMFQNEPAVTAEDFIAALEEAGVELTEEQIDELSKEKLGDYINSASWDKAHAAYGDGKKDALKGKPSVISKKVLKRSKGISRAVSKLTKEDASTLITDFGIELTEEQAEMIEASLWKPQEAGFTKKGIAPKGGVKKDTGTYDRKTHDRLSSPSMLDQMKTKSK